MFLLDWKSVWLTQQRNSVNFPNWQICLLPYQDKHLVTDEPFPSLNVFWRYFAVNYSATLVLWEKRVLNNWTATAASEIKLTESLPVSNLASYCAHCLGSLCATWHFIRNKSWRVLRASLRVFFSVNSPSSIRFIFFLSYYTFMFCERHFSTVYRRDTHVCRYSSWIVSCFRCRFSCFCNFLRKVHDVFFHCIVKWWYSSYYFSDFFNIVDCGLILRKRGKFGDFDQ